MVSSSGQSGMTKDIELLLLLSLEAKLPPGRGKEVFTSAIYSFRVSYNDINFSEFLSHISLRMLGKAN